MSDRPILFSGPMVRALLEGRKTQTRRVLKPELQEAFDRAGEGILRRFPGQKGTGYEIGDRLYVREAWRCEARLDNRAPRDIATNYPGVKYIATCEPDDFGIEGKFRQAMHMPRWASRLTLTVTDVRVQRLQEISEEDAKAEGLPHDPPGRPSDVQFLGLWDSLNADRGFGWETNPWVVALTFTVENRNIADSSHV